MRSSRPAIALLASLSVAEIACATSKGNSQESPTARTMETEHSAGLDEIAGAVIAALAAGDAPRATAHFDATLGIALPAAKLQQVWDQLTNKLGPLKEWHPAERLQRAPYEVRTFDLQFERGSLRAIVSIEPTKGEVAGLRFIPLPSARAEPDGNKANPSQRLDFSQEEVRIGTASSGLGGTLTIPTGTRPHPAVLLIAGSGPQDRDGTIGQSTPLKDLAERLSSSGFTVLRYDKRTFARPQDFQADFTIEDEYIRDALLALDLLRSRSSVDPEHVFLLGHSLGAFVVPEIASRARWISGMVLLAPPGRPLTRVVIDQLRARDPANPGLPELTRKATLLEQGKLGAADTFLGVPVRYWADLLARDEMATARDVAKPLLLLRGGCDRQVTEIDFQLWSHGLTGAPDVEAEVLPGLDHVFEQSCGPGGGKRSSSIDRSLTDRLLAFFRRYLATPGSSSEASDSGPGASSVATPFRDRSKVK